MPSSRRSSISVLAAVAVLFGACSSGGGGGGPASDAPTGAAASAAAVGAVQSPASILRANLTTLLHEHVFLTGATTATAIAGEDTAPAAAVLDANSVALSNVIGAVYGPSGAARFLDLWRGHIGLLVGFARASAAADTAAAAAAKEGLSTYQQDMAVFLNTANPNLAEAAMLEDQKSYLAGMQSAITAQVKGDPQAPAKLKAAADHMPRTAAVLVAGIAKNHPGMFEGRVDGSAATLRSAFAAKLQEQAYLSWITAGVIAVKGDTSTAGTREENTREAVAALDESTVGLANMIGSAYGDEAAEGFLELWQAQTDSYVAYARARATGDTTGAQAAVNTLAAEPAKLGAFLAAANPNFDQATLAIEFGAQSRALLTAIDAQAAGAPSRFGAIHVVAGRTPQMADRLSTGIVTQFPALFS